MVRNTGQHMLLRKIGGSSLGIIFFLFSLASVQAQMTVYTDPNAWGAAVPAATTLAIPDIGDEYASGYYLYGYPPQSVTYGNITFSTIRAYGNPLLFILGSSSTGGSPVLSAEN